MYRKFVNQHDFKSAKITHYTVNMSHNNPIGLGSGLPIGRSTRTPHYTYAARPTGKLTSVDNNNVLCCVGR